jgi:hypothetical protein
MVSLLALSCSTTRLRPGLSVQATPSSRTDGKTLVVAEFSRDMVLPEAVGREARNAPLRLTPSHPGRLEWVTPRMLAFHPQESLPPSTRFQVEVPVGTCSLDGHCLSEVYRTRFDTDRLSGQATLDGLAAENSTWGVPKQALGLSFSHPVADTEVKRSCGYLPRGGGARIGVTATAVGGAAGPSARYTVLPQTPLALDRAWTFRCDASLRPVQGSLGLGKPVEREFRTYGPLKLLEAKPDGKKEHDPDHVSFMFLFSNPIGYASKRPIRISPARAGEFSERFWASSNTLRATVSLEPATRYTVTLGADLEDRFGQKLGKEATLELRTGNARPAVSMETGQWVVEATRSDYVLWARNLSYLNVELARLDEQRLIRVLPALRWWDGESVDLDKLKIPSVRKRLDVKGTLNRWDQVRLELPALAGRAAPKTGFYYLSVQAPETARSARVEASHEEVLVNFTNLGVVTKLSAAGGMVWAVSLADAKPVAGAQVTIRDRKGKLKWSGRTGADGTALTPGRAALLPAPKPAPRRAAEGEEGEGDGEGEGEPEEERSGEGLLVFVRSGDDLTVVDPLRSGGLAAYNFKDVSRDESSHAEKLRGFLHTDRGLYRPEDTVHVKGLVRTMRLGKGLAVPAGAKAAVEVKDPKGNTLLEKSVALSRFGGFSLDVTLPGDARLGDYVVTASLPQGTFTQTFAVQEYRTANFEVKGRAEEPFASVGDKLKLRAEARYFYGAPVRRGAVTWRIHSRPRRPSFARYPEFEFVDHELWRDRYDSGQELVTEVKGKLDREGLASLPLRVRAEEGKRWDSDYLVEAEVKDETHQTIAAHFAVPVHRSSLHLGLALGGPVAQAKRARTLRVVALDPEGKPVAASVTVKVVRREWSCAYESVGYRGSYRCQDKKIPVLRRTLEVAPAAPAELAFTPPSSGEYTISVEGRDARRRPRLSSAELWVWGGGAGAWRASDDLTFDVIPDRPSYRPGETARLMLKASLGKATGLVTLEREGVLERRLVSFEAGQGMLEVPLTAAHGPNVYASIVLVQGRSGPGRRGLPRLRMGMINLPVRDDGKRLKVVVSPERPSYRPGETVRATVEVSDDKGRPVSAEVSLAAADEGVLSLIAYQTPDPLPRFFAPWGLSVTTASAYDRLLQLPDPGQKRSATGGDGGKLGSMRSRFLATAFWSPALVTDAKGRATVSFTAPDNLTAFRLMAVAADAGDRFGSADRRFTVAKPLQLLTALPRFFTLGDLAEGGVVIHNETGAAGRATVQASVEGGLALSGPARREIAVPKGGRVPVAFPVRALREGKATLRFAVKLGGESDALELSLPILHPSSPESELVSEGTVREASPVELSLRLPKGALPETAMIDVSVDPDGLAGIEEGLRSLIEYPYGCLEQTTSRVIPLVMVEELARSLAIGGLDGPALQRFLRIGIAKIGRHQTPEGGFSLWPGDKPDAYLTAFALWGLQLAKGAGHPVDAKRVEEGIAYLRRALTSDTRSSTVHNELGDLGGRAFALHVLALLGKPEAQLAAKLRQDRARLPRFGKAFLARALAASLGRRDPAVKELLDELADAAERKHGATLIREPEGKELSWYMSDDVRTTAIVLDAFLALRPRHPLVPRLVKGLMAARRRGSWETTQDNLYALVALTHLAKGAAQREGRAKIAVGERVLLDSALDGDAIRIKRVSFALGEARGPLRLETKGARLHYAVRVRFRRGAQHQLARSAGLTLRHEYLNPATGKPVGELRAGEVVRVRLTVIAPDELHHLAVSERLPAGLEAINMKLATSSRKNEEKRDDDDDSWRPSIHQEIRDDRVSYFAEHLDKGVEVVEFLARATTPGTFVVPSASGEQMYQPEVNARTALRTLRVLPR